MFVQTSKTNDIYKIEDNLHKEKGIFYFWINAIAKKNRR